MQANGTEGAPQVHDAISIQLEPLDCRSSRRRDSNDQIIFRAPSEMVLPSITPRVEERYGKAGSRVNSVRVSVLEPVAPVAGERQVGQSGPSTTRTGLDVLEGKRIGGIANLGEAVFAAARGAACHPFPLRRTGARFRHGRLLDGRGSNVQRLHDRVQRHASKPRELDEMANPLGVGFFDRVDHRN